jgi:hydrophobic/amphiphilic exporter-1 (mainly G- bacteria), HAE1 family
MILVFLGSLRATVAVSLSIPLSILVTFIALALGGKSINAMVLGGLALVFSRLIDNSSLCSRTSSGTWRWAKHQARRPRTAGSEVALPVLAATLTTSVVFLPVTFLYGVSRFLFSALAMAVVISLFASYFVAMTSFRFSAPDF